MKVPAAAEITPASFKPESIPIGPAMTPKWQRVPNYMITTGKSEPDSEWQDDRHEPPMIAPAKGYIAVLYLAAYGWM